MPSRPDSMASRSALLCLLSPMLMKDCWNLFLACWYLIKLEVLPMQVHAANGYLIDQFLKSESSSGFVLLDAVISVGIEYRLNQGCLRGIIGRFEQQTDRRVRRPHRESCKIRPRGEFQISPGREIFVFCKASHTCAPLHNWLQRSPRL